MEYEFIPIVYPNKENDTSIPPSLAATFQITTSAVVPGQGLPFIPSAPYVAPEPVPEPTPLPQNGVLVDSAATLVYHPLTAEPATIGFNQTDNYSLPALITTMAGDQSLYAAYTGGNANADTWSTYPAIQQVSMAGFGMTGMGDIDFAPNKSITNVNTIAISDGGFGSLTLDSDGIQNAGVITGIDSLELNTQILTALPSALLLNGTPIATISDLPNIYEWANYPALSTIQMNAAGTNGPHNIIGCSTIGFAIGTNLTSAYNIGGVDITSSRLIYKKTLNDPVENIIFSLDINGANSAPGTYTGVPKWATFVPSQNVDWAQREITNINKITFNTAAPGLGGASINALNNLNFSLATGLVGQANISGPNSISFWNPDYPGVPGFYINLASKQLSYNGGPNSAYLASDTKLAIPSLYLNGGIGTAGGKLEVLGPIAQTATINGQPCSASWSRYPALEAVQMQFQQMLNVAEIQFAQNIGGPFNLLTINGGGFLVAEGRLVVTSPASADVDLNDFCIRNAGCVGFNGDPGNLLTVAGTTLEWRGQPVQVGPPADNTANWANYNAVNTVTIPHQHALDINPENYYLSYNTSHLNTNIQHGDPSNEFFCPDFDSYPVNFTVHNSRSVSLNSTSVEPFISGIGLNAVAEVNIEGGLFVGINTAVLETNGAATTISAETTVLITTPECSITAAATTITAATLLELTAGELNITAAATTVEVAGLNITAAGTLIEVGGLGITSGITTWGCPEITLAGGNVNVGGVFTTLNAATLTINNTTNTFINSPTTTINSVTTTIAATRTLKVDNIEPTTANALAISGVNTITGRTDIGLDMEYVKKVEGGGAGMKLANIDTFEDYSATNILLQNQQFYQAIPTITLNTNNPTLAYTSATKVWNYPNIPQLMFAIQISGKVVNVLGSSQPPGAPVNIAGYVALNNLTHPALIPLTIPFGLSIVRSVQPINIAQSYFTILYNTPVINDGDPMANGDSYQLQVYLTNYQTNPATDAITVSDAGFQVNIQIAGGL